MDGSDGAAKGSQEAYLHGTTDTDALWRRIADQGLEMHELRREIAAQQQANRELADQMTRLLTLLSADRATSGGAPVVGASGPAPSGESAPSSVPDNTGTMPTTEEKPKPGEEFGDLVAALSRREAPLPGVFSSESGRSFDLFLGRFEIYCLGKFGEQTRENWTGELGRFLEGELLSVFRAFGGGDLSYSLMRQKLAKHCRATKGFAQADELRRFLSAVPEPGEPLYIFAYRLARMYEMAYPGSSSDDLALQARLMSSLPPKEAVGVQQELDTIRSVSGVDLVPWDKIVSVLRRRQDRQKIACRPEGLSVESGGAISASSVNPPVWYASSSSNRGTGQTYTRRPDHAPERTVPPVSPPEPAGSPGAHCHHPASSAGSQPPRNTVCDWCGIPGHYYRNCWRRLGRCLRCGSDQHMIRMCPQPGRNPSRSPPRARSRDPHQGDRPGRAQSVPARPPVPDPTHQPRPSVGSHTANGGPGMTSRPGN